MTTADRPAEEPRRFTRSRDGRIVAGVCQGAAEYFDVDPVIFRVTLAVLAVFGGAGIVIYGLAWLLIPEAGSPSTRLERALEGRGGGRRRDALIVAATVIVVLILAYGNPLTHRVRGAFVAVVLVLAVAALIGRRRTERTQRWAAPRPPDAAPPFGPVNQPTADQPAVWSPAAPRPRSWLGWLIFGGTLLVGGTLGVIALSGAAHPQPADVLAACVAVVGVGMLVGAFYGRAMVMIPFGLMLVGSLAVANALPRDLTWTAGSRTWTPVSAQPQEPYVLGAGDATLDLTELAPHSTSSVVSRIGAGRLVVLVPTGAAVVIHAHTSAGRILFFDREEDGTGVSLNDTHAGSAPRARSVTLDLTMGFGDVEVRNAAA